MPLYENRRGYQAGLFALGGLRVSSDLWAGRRWRFLAGLLTYHEEAERWSGIVETEGNLGRTDILVEASVSWAFSDKWALIAGARVPVWSRVVGSQLTPAVGEIGLTRSFELLK